MGNISPIVVEMLVSAVMLGVLVVPQNYSLEGWMELTTLSDYFCLTTLKSACETQLFSRVTASTCYTLEQYAENMNLDSLAMHCANQRLRSKTKNEQHKTVWVDNLRKLMRLELAHSEEPEPSKTQSGKGAFENELEEKENNRECSNA